MKLDDRDLQARFVGGEIRFFSKNVPDEIPWIGRISELTLHGDKLTIVVSWSVTSNGNSWIEHNKNEQVIDLKVFEVTQAGSANRIVFKTVGKAGKKEPTITIYLFPKTDPDLIPRPQFIETT